jgi:hypothetical protein
MDGCRKIFNKPKESNLVNQQTNLHNLKGSTSVGVGFCLVVFNATFNNISVTLWQSVLLVEEPG